MAKTFNNLRNKMSDDAQKKATDQAQKLMAEMPLNELRAAKQLSQETIARILNKKQANISRLEKNTDMYISTIKHYIEAMGGTLEINAIFPEGKVKINQFQNI
ncbi:MULTISPECIES: XRE family transcriptional regulator [Cysteiniphilum]|uniref:Transcriptional regulator n=1 Tax=Cysteiniphilum litorale TaxID=2056700 RepID=A0A8J2Z2L2_9GAMM|nr:MULTISPECIES: XRE family transcriptional regulator [Cysteiniphilum]GGF91349.1 transcriptional regulator [Cysteiniphilum litorale]